MGHWKEFLPSSGEAGRFLRWKEVAHTTGLSRTTAWRLQKRDEFPTPYAISPGRVGYSEAEIEAWRISRRAREPAPRPVPSAKGVPARPAPETAAPAASPEQPRRPRAALAPCAAETRRPRRRSQHARAIAQQIMLDF